MAVNSSIVDSSKSTVMTNKYAQKMVEMHKEKHTLLDLVAARPLSTVKQYFTGEGLHEEILWHVRHIEDRDYTRRCRYQAGIFESARPTFEKDLQLLVSVSDDERLAVDVLKHVGSEYLDRTFSRELFRHAIALDQMLLPMCRGILSRAESDPNTPKKLVEIHEMVREVRQLYQNRKTNRRFKKRRSNPVFFESMSYLAEDHSFGTSYLLVKKVVEDREIPEEVALIISGYVDEDKAKKMDKMKEDYEKDKEKYKA